ncbi:hypothetical protein Hanom_Chr06g00538041 [Helianthus anomalus]
MCFFFSLFDYLLIYSMGKQRISDIYHQLDSSPKDKGTSSQSNSSRYSANTEEGIFVRKAQFEEPLTAKKRRQIIRKSQEKEIIINKETQEISINPHGKTNWMKNGQISIC